ncbi:MAG: imidazole glycerol phosphate synthase subunit HisH [Rhodospirillales bacterium]|nr:imidazole glycerol phosphate synthase subunit HisH [Rhodospirillales bacterium]
MSVAIIDYGSGNLRSAGKAFERVIGEAGREDAVVVTADAQVVRRADHIVLPGVGAFADCMAGLTAVPGMIDALNEAVLDKGRPFLGICVGMQLMAEVGREYGDHQGLGWISGEVVAMKPAESDQSGPSLKIPHMGWNELRICQAGHPVLKGIEPGAHAYFVHSYAMNCQKADQVLADVDYAGQVTAMVGRDNMVGTQFHPEKSQRTGLRLISNFLAWKP